MADTKQLDEFKADGEDSSTMDPVSPAGGDPKGKNRKADKRVSVDPKADDIEDDVKKPGGEPFDKTSPASRKGTGKKAPARRADKTGMKESVEEMFAGQDLSEDFKEKASVIFEAAVNNKLAEEVERLEEEFETRLEEETQKGIDELSEQIDTYLDYVVENWAEENKIAIENGIKTEMAESFMNGLYNLFVEHNVDVPEESENILDELAAQLEEVEDKLDEAVNENIELAKALEEHVKNDIFDEMSEGLTETQAEKLKRLAEGVGFDDVDSFTEKLSIIKENYFGGEKMLKETVGDDVDPVEEANVKVQSGDPTVLKYAANLSKTLRK